MIDPCPLALRGIVPSLDTPLLSAQTIDIAGSRHRVDHMRASGCTGMLLLAVAGEGPGRDVIVGLLQRLPQFQCPKSRRYPPSCWSSP